MLFESHAKKWQPHCEAASLAGHLKLGKLIYLYDSNDISLDGPTNLAFTEDVAKRYESYGWQVLRVEDGDNDLDALDQAIRAAKADTERPTLIEVKTTIGFGSPNKAGSEKSHGSPLGTDELVLTKEALGWPTDKSFHVPDEVAAAFAESKAQAAELEKSWTTMFDAWTQANPKLAKEWHAALSNELLEGWDADMPAWEAGDKPATRVASGKCINQLAANIPWFLGGDADLSCSTKTAIGEDGDFNGQTGTDKEGDEAEHDLEVRERDHWTNASQGSSDAHDAVVDDSTIARTSSEGDQTREAQESEADGCT